MKDAEIRWTGTGGGGVMISFLVNIFMKHLLFSLREKQHLTNLLSYRTFSDTIYN